MGKQEASVHFTDARVGSGFGFHQLCTYAWIGICGVLLAVFVDFWIGAAGVAAAGGGLVGARLAEARLQRLADGIPAFSRKKEKRLTAEGKTTKKKGPR